MKETNLKDASEGESIEKAKQYMEELIRMHINADFCYMEVDNKLLHIVMKILSESKIPTCGIIEDIIEFIEENNYKYINFNDIIYFIKRTKDELAKLRNIHSISPHDINNAKNLFEETVTKYKELQAKKGNLMREGKKVFWRYFFTILTAEGVLLGLIGTAGNITLLSLGGYIAAWILSCFYLKKIILYDIKAIKSTEIDELWEDL